DKEKGLKMRVLRAFYSANRPKNPLFHNQMKARIQRKFPSIARMLWELKTRDHARAAQLMQNWEATVFIRRICGRIMKDGPDPPLFTKHDCVLTTPDAVENVRGVVLDEFAKLGCTPSLKFEDYRAL